MSGLGVLADHHCSVYVSPPITRQRRVFCLLGCRGTPFLLQSGFFLSPYPSRHVSSSSNLACLFWVVSHPSRTPPRKSLNWNLKNRFFSLSPPLNHALWIPNPWPHHALYWLGTGWWCLSLARAFLPYVSEICLLPICLPWSGGLPTYPVIRFPWPFMWAAFDFPLFLRVEPYLLMDLTFLWPTSWFPSFLTICSVILTVMT